MSNGSTLNDWSSGTEKEVTAEVDPELHMTESILAGLGPRYAEWAGNRPVPVDGDLILTGDNSGFKRPFRLVPHGVKPQLSNEEMTELRRQARPMPPHFMLGTYLLLPSCFVEVTCLHEVVSIT